jgi:hypothetical protein
LNIENELDALLEDRDFMLVQDQRARFNLFEAIGAVRSELRHSNFLAFLLSPSQTHGLGANVLRPMLKAVVELIPRESREISSIEIAVAELNDAIVYREYGDIDILIEVSELKCVVVIENKIDANESDGQLEKYKAFVDKKYPDWRKFFVFLTPEGDNPGHPLYVAFSYRALIGILKKVLADERILCSADVGVIIKHYTEMMGRRVVEDEGLRELAVKIYARHKDAIDFIWRSLPEPTSLLSIGKALAEGVADLKSDSETPTAFRFFPSEWSEIKAFNACPLTKWTKTGRNLLFEIKVFRNSDGEFTNRVLLSLLCGPAEPTIRQAIFDSAHENRGVFVGAGNTINRDWVTIFSQELLAHASGENMDEDGKRAAIAQNWETFAVRDLPRLRSELQKIGQRIEVGS